MTLWEELQYRGVVKDVAGEDIADTLYRHYLLPSDIHTVLRPEYRQGVTPSAQKAHLIRSTLCHSWSDSCPQWRAACHIYPSSEHLPRLCQPRL